MTKMMHKVEEAMPIPIQPRFGLGYYPEEKSVCSLHWWKLRQHEAVAQPLDAGQAHRRLRVELVGEMRSEVRLLECQHSEDE